MKKILFIVLLTSTIWLTGCLTARQAPAKVVLLQEDRIYTLPAGQEVNILLDGKPLKMTFPQVMKITTDEELVRKEAKLNEALLNKVKADGDKQKMMTIFGSILAILAAALGIFFKMKSWVPKIKGNVEIK